MQCKIELLRFSCTILWKTAIFMADIVLPQRTDVGRSFTESVDSNLFATLRVVFSDIRHYGGCKMDNMNG